MRIKNPGGMLLPLLLALARQPAAAASPDVTGLFVMTQGAKAMNERVYEFPFVKGISIRTYWKQAAPSKGAYDWGYIDENIAQARKNGRQVMLRVLPGAFSPDWVKKGAGATFKFKDINPQHETFGAEQEMPVPWDENYLAAWTGFVKAMGVRYSTDTAVVLVHVAGPTRFSAEMHLPNDPGEILRWQELGYSPDKLIKAWKRCIDAFAGAFPSQVIALNASLPVKSDGVLEAVVDYGIAKYGKRFALQGNWLCPKIPDQDRPVYDHIKTKKGKCAIGFQFIGAAALYREKRAPEMSETEILRQGFALGRAAGASYYEIYLKDLKDRESRKLFKDVFTAPEK